MSRQRQKGNAFIEFALCMAFLAPILAGTFTIGMTLLKGIQVGQVCRNANVLRVRGIDLSRTNNQRIVVKAAQGLGMALNAQHDPNPGGKGLVILSRILRVGALECSSVTRWNGVAWVPDPRAANTSSCPNYGSYVFTNRIVIGNTALGSSTFGNPGSARDSYGDLTINDFVLDSGNRATGFDTVLTLALSDYAYVSEAMFDVAELNIFNITAPRIYVRNIS